MTPKMHQNSIILVPTMMMMVMMMTSSLRNPSPIFCAVFSTLVVVSDFSMDLFGHFARHGIRFCELVNAVRTDGMPVHNGGWKIRDIAVGIDG